MPYLENDSTNVHFKEKDVLEHDSPPLPTVSATLKQRVVTCQNMSEPEINIVPYLQCIKVKQGYWQEFVRKLEQSGQTVDEYFTYAVNDEIENALFHDPRLLEPDNPKAPFGP